MLSYGLRLKYFVFGKEVLVRIDKNRLRSCSGLRWLVPFVYNIAVSTKQVILLLLPMRWWCARGIYMRLNSAKLNDRAASFVLLGIFIFLTVSCTPVNHSPVITTLEAKQSVLGPLDSCVVECIASDPDGDELTYEWSASDGNINGDGAAVAWSAPEAEGSYNIMVKVVDGNDGEVTDSMNISVKRRAPRCGV